MCDVIFYFVIYVFEKGVDIFVLLGVYIFEGLKVGVIVVFVWVVYYVLFLNVVGYGKLIGVLIEGLYYFYNFLNDLIFKVGDKEIEVYILIYLDFNMVDYVFKEKGNDDLVVMNKLNYDVYDYVLYVKGNIYNNEFIILYIDFVILDYGNSLLKFVNSLGFSDEEWNCVGKVIVLCVVVMILYMNDKEEFDVYVFKI